MIVHCSIAPRRRRACGHCPQALRITAGVVGGRLVAIACEAHISPPGEVACCSPRAGAEMRFSRGAPDRPVGVASRLSGAA